MADNNFRASRGRDPIAREDVDPTADDARDPLAELARLIGQRDRVNEFDRGARHAAVETLDDPAPAAGSAEFAAGDGYAEPDEPERYADEDYVQPRLPDPHPSDRAFARDERDDERSPPLAGHYAEPAGDYDDAPEDEPAYEPRYRDDDAPPPRSAVRQPPAQSLTPQSYADEYEDDGRWDGNPDRQSDVAEDADEEYDDGTPSRSRRGGVAVVLAMLGLVLVGAAGAFAYRAMFGGAILVPSLPPIIKANDGPTKIVPNHSEAQAGAPNQAAGANPGSPEKLVSREEQPVPIQPPNAAPRVVATIPVLPAPGGAPGAAPAGALPPAPVSPAPPAVSPKVAVPAQPAAAAPAPVGSTEPKKVHTVTIRPDQMGGTPNVPAAAPAPTPAPPAALARPRATEPAGVRPGPAPAPRGGGNAPLAIVPAAQGAAPPVEPPRSRVTRTEAPAAPVATAPAAPSGGGYAVQVTSQRSEAEAETAFKSLQAKFPAQLGNRQPIIHRADLGEKGTYYRAMVGPFASSEAAASMCSNLKAAGGSCIVQKN